MVTIEEVIGTLKKEWSCPRRSVHGGKESNERFFCLFEDSGIAIPYDLHYTIPQDLIDFWAITTEAILFKDAEYGQWGLKMLSPNHALHETQVHQLGRPREYRRDDFVIGTFYSDTDLVVIRCDENAPDFGSIMISTCSDKRKNWVSPAATLKEFLALYYKAMGEKYWEPEHSWAVR